MNTARVAALLALFAAFVAAVLAQEEPSVMLVGLALPVWIALEGCWRLLDPKR